MNNLPTQVCASTIIQFTDASTGNITRWWWDFGDNTGSSQQNPVHQYRDTGRFTVTLQVENNGCKTVVKYDPPIKIEAPVAKFISNNNCTDKYNRSFTDKSLGAKTWSWDFGDGTKSNVQNPSHTYSAKGTYVVKLVVTNGSCQDETSNTIEIIDEHPIFSYGTQKTELCRNESVLFKASNFDVNNLRLLSWDFGDGEITGFAANNSTISHIYNTNGQFIPRLFAKDKLGCIDTIVNAGISFNIYGPTAKFSNPAGTCINGTIPFTDNSVSDGTHAISKWVWTYGDGKQEATNGGTKHKYDSAGNFNVKLVVSDSYGCKDSIVKNRAVIITNPVVAFSISDSIRCSDNNVNFTDASQGLALTYAWDFGDGKRANIQNPKHVYSNEGVFSIALKITDRFGCTDSVFKREMITISNPKASFILKDTFSVCPPLLVQPQNTSHNFSSLVWDFGEGNSTQLENPSHLYTTAGNFDLRLIVKGHGNCFDTARKAIVIKGPSGKLEYAPLIACNPTEISFSATTLNTDRIIWDFNDGVTLQNMNTNIKHSYTEKGKYVPKLVLVDAAGCRVGIENKDTITVADVNAGISIANNAGCDSSIISFSDSSRAYFNKINKYQWSFGDNSFSNEQNPTHTFYKSGVYSVSLVVHSDIGCKDSFTIPAKIQVNKSPKVNITAPDSVCMLSVINFKATDITNDSFPLNWSWNFGNGTLNSTQNPQFNYGEAGNFKISVSATNQFGCINTATHPISIIGLPKVDAGLDSVICLGSSIKLNGSGASKYTWLPNPLLSCVNCPDPVVRPVTSQTFYLSGTNSFGCKASDSVFIKVNAPMPITVSNNDTLCLGETASLKAKGANIYKWSPGIYLDNPVSDNPVFFPSKDTAITYQVVGWDDKKCFADTAVVTMKVYPIPEMKMENKDITLNVGSSVQLKTINSPDVTQWRWTPSTGLDDPTSASPMASPKESIIYTCVAINDGACIARNQVSVKVLCNDANIFLPNTFSPNRDGMNDVFYPRGKGLFNIKSMRIFNRWGQIVFEKNNFSPNKENDGWDGTSKGSPLASDVYVYMIEVLCENSSIIPVKGNVTLIR